ncbi:hypothetical protein TH53_03570 [Pedobacter lusitanus]|uniref:Aminoglycoside phosphotransferase domain-containing protein n=1 Tax=Pedobacter lusitanus TaxID=1503925 RepID=A0A0D0GVN3_9SPHI|nr:aminoglycoside phosphotransferase family protein [Pedobacter lusitanus]KIO78491.1 hypothetical protein TH53_03570 [Pedobacter lusitanus]
MHIKNKEAETFLSKKFKNVTDLQYLAQGWWAQAFSFNCEAGKLVLRVGVHLKDFLKDKFAYQTFNSPDIPVVKIVETGKFSDKLYYCLSLFCEGMTADKLLDNATPEVAASIAPSILKPLYHIHRLDTSKRTGWGLTDINGNGIWKSWPEYLSAIYNHKYPVSWQEMGRTTWLDPILFGRLHQRMQELFVYLPHQKNILHGDYGYDNLLLDQEHKVTAVLDWAEMLLGDELYDLVSMNDPWVTTPEDTSFLALWKKEMESGQEEIYNFEQRLECYRIHYTLFSLHIFTAHQKEEDYTITAQWAEKQLL